MCSDGACAVTLCSGTVVGRGFCLVPALVLRPCAALQLQEVLLCFVSAPFLCT
jgi:hypothetical protein